MLDLAGLEVLPNPTLLSLSVCYRLVSSARSLIVRLTLQARFHQPTNLCFRAFCASNFYSLGVSRNSTLGRSFRLHVGVDRLAPYQGDQKKINGEEYAMAA